MLDRTELLKNYIKEEPENPFNYYALALEYLTSNKTEAVALMKLLLTDFPQYLPTYYQAAAIYIESGEHELAKKIYGDGIALAQIQKNDKTLKELKGALQMLLDEEME